MRKIRLLMATMATTLLGTFVMPLVAVHALPTTTTVVKSSDIAVNFTDVSANPTKWLFYNDETDQVDSTLGSFVTGPSTPPAGVGSAQISVSGTQRRNLATYQFSGTPLASITELKYSTYNSSTGNGGGSQRSGYLQFNVDFNGSDTWQKRLTYVPANNGTVTQNHWNQWDAISSGTAKWTYSGANWPTTGQSGDTAKTWGQILVDYPTARIRVSDAQLSIRVGEPYADGYTENIDKVVFGTASSTKVFDFEPMVGPPTSKDQCKNDGWKTFNNPSFKNQGKCIQYVEEHRSPEEVKGTLKLSGPNQKIVFNVSGNDDDHGWFKHNKKDTVEYWNYDYPGVLHYKADVLCVGGDRSMNEARVMFQIPQGYPGLSGLYIVSYAKEVKHGTDLYGHAATGDLATATAWCKTGTGFAPAMYPVVKGEVEIN